MSPDMLLKHFGQVAEAPDAIMHLRRFLLDLAVRGKLVEQHPNDEPAAELLKRIRTERKHLASEGSVRGEKLFSPLEEDELPFAAPAGWAWTRIRQVTSDRGQKVPDRRFSYIDVGSINKEIGCVGETKILAASEAPSRARKLVATGDVIYSCVRPYLLNIAIIENEIRPEPIVSTAFAVLNGFGLVLPRYLWIALRSPFMVDCVEALMRGQAYPAINDADFALLPLPLPPLSEQHRIVAKVDELMALCDELEAVQQKRESRRDRLVAASLHALNNGDDDEADERLSFADSTRFYLNHLPRLTTRPEHIKQLRQTILNLAVRGKLVAQDPKEEPASELLAKTAVQKKKAGNQRTGRDWVGDVVGLAKEAFIAPDGWVWTRIGNTVERVTVGYVGPMKDQYVEGGIPFLRSQNVRANRFREEGLISISLKFHHTIAKSALAPGDVVVVRSGNVGTACAIPPSLKEANCSDLVVVKKPIAVLPTYLCFYLNSLASAHVEEGSVGVALTHFNTKSVATMPFPLPPLAEQHRIVAKVDELMAMCDALETQVTSSAETRGRLLEATLQEALSGIELENHHEAS